MLPELKTEVDLDLQNTPWDVMRARLNSTRQHLLQFLGNGAQPDTTDVMRELVGYTATTVKRIPIMIDAEPFTLLIATNAARIEGTPMTDDQDIEIILSNNKTPGQKPKTTTLTIPAKDKFADYNHTERLTLYKSLVLMEEDIAPIIRASLNGQETQITTHQGILIESFAPSTGA